MIYEDKTAGEVSVKISSGRSDVINFTQILLENGYWVKTMQKDEGTIVTFK
jgi:hypothetical protein